MRPWVIVLCVCFAISPAFADRLLVLPSGNDRRAPADPGASRLSELIGLASPVPLQTDAAIGKYFQGRIVDIVAPAGGDPGTEPGRASLVVTLYGARGAPMTARPVLINDLWLYRVDHEIDGHYDFVRAWSNRHLSGDVEFGGAEHAALMRALLDPDGSILLNEGGGPAPESRELSEGYITGYLLHGPSDPQSQAALWPVRRHEPARFIPDAGSAGDVGARWFNDFLHAAARAARYPRVFEPGFREKALRGAELLLSFAAAVPELAGSQYAGRATRLKAVGVDALAALVTGLHPVPGCPLLGPCPTDTRMPDDLRYNAANRLLPLSYEDVLPALVELVSHARGLEYFVDEPAQSQEVVRTLVDFIVARRGSAHEAQVARALDRILGIGHPQHAGEEADRDDFRSALYETLDLADARRALVIDLFQRGGWGKPERVRDLIDRYWAIARPLDCDGPKDPRTVPAAEIVAAVLKTDPVVDPRTQGYRNELDDRVREMQRAAAEGFASCEEETMLGNLKRAMAGGGS